MCLAHSKEVLYNYHILPCIMCVHIFVPNFQEKIFHLNTFNSIFIYLCLETEPIIIFQDIILHMDIVIALSSYTFNA